MRVRPARGGGSREGRRGGGRGGKRPPPAVVAEGERRVPTLKAPARRLVAQGEERALLFDDVEGLVAAKAFIVDACRHVGRQAGTVISLARGPALFTLARSLGEAWPADASREALVLRAFRLKRADESQRARLRVEIGHLRTVLRPLAE